MSMVVPSGPSNERFRTSRTKPANARIGFSAAALMRRLAFQEISGASKAFSALARSLYRPMRLFKTTPAKLDRRITVRPIRSIPFVVCLVGIASAGVAAAQQPPAGPKTLFSAPLADMPGKQLVVVELMLPPRQEGSPPSPGHRHPGSVWVYVTEGVARL